MNKNKDVETAVEEIQGNKTPVKKYKIKKSRKGLWFDESWQTAHRCIDTYHRIRIKLPIGDFEMLLNSVLTNVFNKSMGQKAILREFPKQIS